MDIKRIRPLQTLACIVGSLIGLSGAVAGTTLQSRRVASGLTRPVGVYAAPGDSQRLFIVEKRGVIRVLNLPDESINVAPFLNIDAQVGGGQANESEQGLLGLAFHPDYAANGFFFVYYTNNSGATVVARYNVSTDPDVADAGSAMQVLSYSQPQANHNAGWIGFGPEGFLYIATGDGGNRCDVSSGHTSGTGNAQDVTNNLLGKILRIDVDGDNFPADADRNYAVPPDNPYVGITGDDEIWAHGLRNPWRCSFDRMTGDFYIADVGQDLREEVDFQPANAPGTLPGEAGYQGDRNYGWNCTEGTLCATASPSNCITNVGCVCNDTALTPPIHDYSHQSPPPPTTNVCAIIGGYVYRGCDIPDLDGAYFFGDYCGAGQWSFRVVGGAMTEYIDRSSELSPSIGGVVVNQIVSYGEDARGELYIVDQGAGADGQIFKIVAANPLDPGDIDADGDVDSADAELLVQALLGDPGPTRCQLLRADVNRDDHLDGRDIGAWVGRI